MPKPKKILKIIGGVIIFFTLPSLLFFAFMYFKYNEDLPTGEKGLAADKLAIRMLNALNHDAYKATDYIEFTFKKRHHFKWNKAENTCEVYWKNIRVDLNLSNNDNSEVYVSEKLYTGEKVHDYIHKAEDLFNNDTFWLVAPYKVFDEGVERRLVKTEDDKDALLVTYTNGGSTPGDSYLWHFDDNGKPTSYQMWVDILPIDGLEASWSDWTTTETGVQLPTFHKLLVLGLEIEGIKTEQLELKDGDITNMDVVFIRTGISSPSSIQDMELRYMYAKHDGHVFQKTINNRSFLNTFKKKFSELKSTKEDGRFMDARFSILINYKSKPTDTLALGEHGTIALNDVKHEFSEELVNMLKDELMYYIKY
ncbi:hypothetical protein [uncultured Psychroserpens sp.]|uniref:hypothetical protein n=1 Tax=uncultured Psychroserpens sp. TaxID=255436 RepID=UPI002620FF56|nr:hypothetical protein [uncultured Psychroserpens sp.]